MFLTVKRKSLIAAALVVLMMVVCCIGMSFGTVADVYNNQSVRKLPIYGVDCAEKKVALTFDAAWGADKTQGIIDALAKYEVKGTFFLVGFWIDEYPEMVKKIAESGCEIGNHSKNHLHMSKLSKGEIISELDYVSGKVEELTGIKPKYFRPPFGEYNSSLITQTEGCGMQAVQWTIDSLDWKGLGAQEIMSRVKKGLKPGSIILFHNNSDNILEALPLVLACLKSEGYTAVGLSEMIMSENYYIDNNGIQRKIA